MHGLSRKLLVALAVGLGSVGIFGAAALGAFRPDVSTSVNTAIAPAASAVLGDKDRPDKLKDVLDGLVKKGVITQLQEDAILAAVKDAAGDRVKVEAILRDFLGTSARYLGISKKELRAKLPGTSLAAIANGTPGKSRDGLVAALNKEGNADIDKALANKRISNDQAKKLRDELPGKVNAFVDRTWPAAGRAANVKGFLGDLLETGRDYLGLPLADLTTQLRAGKSLGEIANATPGKSRDGLVAALVTAANTRIDKALADKKLTVDQAKALKDKVGSEIATLVDRKMAPKTTTGKNTTNP